MSDFDKRKLRFVVMPTRFYPPECHDDMSKAYQCWRQVWGHAFQTEMNVKDDLYSDNFTRKSHVACLFFGDEPLGVCTTNVLDLTLAQDLDDSYFKVFPETVMEKLKLESKLVITCCNATINFTFRKNRLGLPGLDLLFGMMIHYLKSTPADVILGTARLEKGVEKVCYRTAATCLASNLPYTIPGQTIDLIGWYRDLDMNTWDPHLLEVTSYVWNKRTSIISPISKGVRHAA